MVTNYGLEGSAIYALSAEMRQALSQGPATIRIDLRPALSEEAIAERLARTPAKHSLANRLRRALKFSALERALLHEAGSPPDLARDLAALVKNLPLEVSGHQGLERAISTAGGIAARGLTDAFMLIEKPGLFVAGEMLDFDAPTGGYLLQAALACGRMAGQGAVEFLARAED